MAARDMPVDQFADVIIIGAGVAGLAAAEVLGKAGLTVIVLEGQGRLGGRIWSLPGLAPGHSIELGAEFVHGRPRPFDDYVKHHGLELIETDGQMYCADDADTLKPCREFGSHIFERLARMRIEGVPDEPFETTLQTTFADCSEREKQWARMFVGGFHAASPSRISTQSIILDSLAEEDTDGDRAFHIVGGYAKLVNAMVRAIPANVSFFTRTPVTEVDWRRDPVMVRAGLESSERLLEFTAPSVIVTLPLGVLQQRYEPIGAVKFRPPLTDKQHALSKLAMGPVVRLSLQFRAMFWEDGAAMHGRPLRNLHFLFTRDRSFPTWWTASPQHLPILVAWCAGPCAAAKESLEEGELCDAAIQALARILAVPKDFVAGQLSHAYYHDWQSDPFSRGAYSYVLAGGMGAQTELARPLQNRLFFAGEATQSDGHHATVHGAFSSGVRAARELLGMLRQRT